MHGLKISHACKIIIQWRQCHKPLFTDQSSKDKQNTTASYEVRFPHVFVVLGALIIGHTTAAPISDLGKELIKRLVSSNEQAEVETSDSIKNQVHALI